MLNLVLDRLHDRDFMIQMLIAIAVMATILTFAMPLVAGDDLGRRMRAVSVERNKIRERERAALAAGNNRANLRPTTKAWIMMVVDKLQLTKHLAQDEARMKLIQAGYRGQAPYFVFLLFRMVVPVITFFLALIYLFVINDIKQPAIVRMLLALFAAYVGLQLPMLFLKNEITKRQTSIKRAFPDSLDLLLICVESGMSIEVAFKRVSQEVGSQSVALAEELTLTTAELSYLQDRRMAYENLAKRTDLDGVRAVSMALIQAERYGTPLANTLRVMAQENRDMRMSDAEKKAASLPPKLTVPMIVFFLPCLFVVIMGPAVIRLMASN
ncbi:type II secretion system F family protein [Phreatobacter aquaticus]|uniref:Type II secretion system F family protein n=1 Tax=Phreatobacter aquaticus TaxID=2570229 RepID=A0A4D7QIS1_9HYPH|nr:type II secretion system F family protein [Phreatobacter aquaticus]QCK85296.1 type II secretion system F family protein [Phreatobacter aquaticus]